MATSLKLRRGTTSQHSTFTGAEGEVTVDTTKDTLVVHDGSTAGGFPLAKSSDLSSYALDNAVVKLTGDQTIGGTKTFSSTISGSVSGNAGTVTNGVYTTGDQTIGGTKTFSSTITGSISGNAGTVTNGVYTTGDQTIGGTKTLSDNPVLNAGTANGVLYLNGSKAATSGSVITFDGSTLSVNSVQVGRGAGNVSSNTAIGTSALAANTTGANNTAVGYLALNANVTGIRNTAVGRQAGRLHTESYSTFVGYNAGNSNTTGAVTFIGVEVGASNTTGTSNVAVGVRGNGSWNTFESNTTGSYNNAFGGSALSHNTTGSYNVAIGEAALWSNTTASNNTAIGYFALYANTTGADNTAVGYNAGDEITTGTGNTIIGSGASASAATGVDQIVIGRGVTGQANTNVTIGNATGKIYNAYTVNATWTQTSDGRLKRNIQDDTLGLSFINRLRPVKYQWKPSNEIDPSLPYYNEENKRDTETVMHGLVAQEVKAALDAEGVSTFAGWDQGPDTIQAISREMFVSPLIKSVQELSAQVVELKAEIATLKGN